jgi:hypothetical protein
MNESQFQDKLDEIAGIASQLLARSVRLESQVAELQSQVRKLDERLTYKEKILVGWKDIAAYLGYRDVARARALNARAFDPLPAVKQNGNMVAHATALDAWKERQKDFQRSGFTFDDDGALVPDGRMKSKIVPRETGETPS